LPLVRHPEGINRIVRRRQINLPGLADNPVPCANAVIVLAAVPHLFTCGRVERIQHGGEERRARSALLTAGSPDCTSPLEAAKITPFTPSAGAAQSIPWKPRSEHADRARRSSPAVLYALDASTGKEMWNSGSNDDCVRA